MKRKLMEYNYNRSEDGDIYPCSICESEAPTAFFDRERLDNVTGFYGENEDKILICEFCASSRGCYTQGYKNLDLSLEDIYKNQSMLYHMLSRKIEELQQSRNIDLLQAKVRSYEELMVDLMSMEGCSVEGMMANISSASAKIAKL